ncbi:MAG: hypothetical protein DCC71_16115 [Proteobacteria bacterium]|nr:MAG: hypothetical protein DCC71_16115 [Pseudomonadota bacterium]
MSRRSCARLLLGVALAAALCAPGCAAFRRNPPEKQRFMLVGGSPEPAPRGAAGIVRVDLVRGSPLVANRGFVYRVGTEQMSTDFYHEFVAPPGVLLRERLIDWLRATGAFTAVVRGSKAQIDWILETDLDRFHADVRDRAAPEVKVEVEVRLLDTREGAPTLAMERRYETSAQAAGIAAPELVDAWSRATSELLDRVAADVAAAARGAAPSAARR